MPSHRCQWPTCDQYIPERGYCPDHANAERTSAAAYYDKHLRDPRAKAFYNSAAWQRVRRSKLADFPVCEWPGCGRFAEHVHHVTPIRTPEGWERRLDISGLQALCVAHHNEIEKTNQ